MNTTHIKCHVHCPSVRAGLCPASHSLWHWKTPGSKAQMWAHRTRFPAVNSSLRGSQAPWDGDLDRYIPWAVQGSILEGQTQAGKMQSFLMHQPQTGKCSCRGVYWAQISLLNVNGFLQSAWVRNRNGKQIYFGATGVRLRHLSVCTSHPPISQPGISEEGRKTMDFPPAPKQCYYATLTQEKLQLLYTSHVHGWKALENY